MYAYTQTDDKKEHKKCKGVSSYVVKKHITFENYLHTQKTGIQKEVEMTIFRSYEHQIYTEQIKKVALSSNDDKSFICDDQINCLTFGHYKIKSNTTI